MLSHYYLPGGRHNLLTRFLKAQKECQRLPKYPEGAMAFLRAEYKVLFFVVAVATSIGGNNPNSHGLVAVSFVVGHSAQVWQAILE